MVEISVANHLSMTIGEDGIGSHNVEVVSTSGVPYGVNTHRLILLTNVHYHGMGMDDKFGSLSLIIIAIPVILVRKKHA